jgi:hypothetical protein
MPPDRRDLFVTLAILAVVVGTVVLANLVPSADRLRGPSTSAFGEREPTCAAWSDGCITCERTDHGPSCSTPGIACVRSPVQCLKRGGV